MKINVWFRQGGYLFLARNEPRSGARSRRASPLQNECGLATRMLSPRRGADASCPSSTSSGVVAASYNPDDGVVFPWPFVWGYAQAARKLGVEIATFTDVVGFETTGARIDGVRVRRCGPPGAGGRTRAPRSRPTASSTRPARGRPEIAQHARRRAPEQTPPPRDLLDRAAQAVAQAAGRRSRRTASTSRSRRAARSSAASATSTSRRGSTRRARHAFLGLYAQRARPRVPRPRRA